ncbi:MAG TPA: 2-oxo-4-hydroxy-4-carboxy-5-ureidoimidazoline decarboxylase [Kineosporiaceae bacterium]|nr:2-oxo-4-hydroxy-4-carboxy-5-ureidoimidazoline decarboxylase [Kineosporiaceae bacterium]
MRSIKHLAAGVTVFNALAEDEATPQLAHCLQAPDWAASLLAGRPYPDRESLLATAYRFGAVLSDDDLVSALSAHPRIGERPAGTGIDAAHSRAEQGGVDADDASLGERLHAGNLAYEEKFGRVFLIRAAGRDGPQILAALTERLANDPATEERVVRDQLAQIAQLRLGALLDELGGLT